MNNVIDTVLNTSATSGKIKYNLKHSDNTTEVVEIELATPVQVEGTAINKVLFDSIRTDLTNLNNNKLSVSNKATENDVITGTDNSKYITPQALTGKIKKLNVTGSCTTITAPPHNTDVLDFTAYPNKTILITGRLNATGTGDTANFCRLNVYNGTTSIMVASKEYNTTGAVDFFMYVDTKYNIVKYEKRQGSDTTSAVAVDTNFLKLSNLQKLNMVYNGTNTTYDLTILILD